MARLKTMDKIDNVKKKMNQMHAQLKALESQQKIELRKADTRRKIVAGGLVLNYCKKNPDDPFSVKLIELIAEQVNTQKDRALFGLEPSIAQSSNQPEQQKPGATA